MKQFFLLAIILIIGFLFRFNNLNWDNNFHLHPDERFLTMVGNAMNLPKNIGEYLNPKISKLNPNNIGYKFFVYGNFPLVLNKYIAVFFNKDNYNDFTILGRNLSAYFDLLIIILVYKTIKLLFPRNKSTAFWSAFFYAIAVYPIQASHFFTVDTFLNFFMFGSFYFAIRYNILVSAVFFGLAVASKISAIYILPLILLVVFIKKPKNIVNLLLFFAISYITLRFANPYYFQNSNFFDLSLNQTFINNIKQLKSFESKGIWYPPAVQWMNKPVTFLLINLALVGVGFPYFVIMVVGIVWVISNIKNQILKIRVKTKKDRNNLAMQFSNETIIFITLLWIIGYFVYQSISIFKSIRYTIYLYPFFAIFAAIGIEKVISYLLLVIKGKYKFLILNSTFLILLLIWPLLFSTIYLNKHTRVEASEWIYKNLPNGSYILSESWDDGLPVPIINNYGKQFTGEQLPVFDPDTPEKWQKIKELLTKADYYILSSNRGWGSISSVPEKYPKMSKFYNDLLSGINPQYKKIKQFDPFYYRFIKFSDSLIEETFTVYDHPQVLIYKNVKKL